MCTRLFQFYTLTIWLKTSALVTEYLWDRNKLRVTSLLQGTGLIDTTGLPCRLSKTLDILPLECRSKFNRCTLLFIEYSSRLRSPRRWTCS